MLRKLYIFDLDGVLLDSSNIHFNTFNEALCEITGRALTPEEHETTFNGLSTRMKLKMLEYDTQISDAVYKRKQDLTRKVLSETCTQSERLIEMVAGLKREGVKLVCASNCIRETVLSVLTSLGIYSYFDMVVSNEDVAYPKPNPEMYMYAMKTLGISPDDTIVFEDSYVGLTAAMNSGAHVHRVTSPTDLTLTYATQAQPNLTKTVNVVIPMAGNGSRFASVGYKDPKPLIPVFGQPMISWVVKNLGIDAQYTFLIRKDFDHARPYLESLVPGCNVISIDSVTEGAACTVLLAKQYIDNNNPLLLINSDQYIEFDSSPTALKFVTDFLYSPSEINTDGKISTFDGKRHPKWSYAKVGEDGFVSEVREKDPFSDHATTGLYMWRRGSDFVKYANQMISKNIRVNNEFYVVPTFNEAIADGKKITICGCTRMWGIGVPEDLDYFLTHFKHESETS